MTTAISRTSTTRRSPSLTRRARCRARRLVAYMQIARVYFHPLTAIWPAANVNARLQRVQLLDPDGRPKLDANGDPVSVGASDWLARTAGRGNDMDTGPAAARIASPRWRLDRTARQTTFNLYGPPRIKPGDAPKPGLGSTMCDKVFRAPTPTTPCHWLAHRVQFPRRRSITASCWAAPRDRQRHAA